MPAICVGVFAAIYVHAMALLAPPFFKYVFELKAGQGEAIRAALFWSSIELAAPLSGGLAGAMIAGAIQRIIQNRARPAVKP